MAFGPGFSRRGSLVGVSASEPTMGSLLPTSSMGRADGSLCSESECGNSRPGHGAVSSRVDSVVLNAERARM